MGLDSKTHDFEIDLYSLKNERKLSNAAKTIINKVIIEQTISPRFIPLVTPHSSSRQTSRFTPKQSMNVSNIQTKIEN